MRNKITYLGTNIEIEVGDRIHMGSVFGKIVDVSNKSITSKDCIHIVHFLEYPIDDADKGVRFAYYNEIKMGWIRRLLTPDGMYYLDINNLRCTEKAYEREIDSIITKKKLIQNMDDLGIGGLL